MGDSLFEIELKSLLSKEKFDELWNDLPNKLKQTNSETMHTMKFVPDKDTDIVYCGMFRGEFKNGDVISYLAGGGGGYGDPMTRPAEWVREDVVDGYVSRKSAEKDYGVVLNDQLEIDKASTNKLRKSHKL